MEIDFNYMMIILIPAAAVVIPAIVKLVQYVRKPVKMIEELTESVEKFKIDNRLNRKELLHEIKLEILENYSYNHEKIALLESEVKRVSEKCDMFNMFVKDTSNNKQV